MTEQHDQWQATSVRCPDDVPTVTPLSWMVEKQRDHAERLSNLQLPADFPHDVERGDADDALAILALGEAIRLDVERGRGSRLHQALTLGATWRQVAAALDITPDAARTELLRWAAGQRHLHQTIEEQVGTTTLGLDTEQHAAVQALAELGDDQPAPEAAVTAGTEAR